MELLKKIPKPILYLILAGLLLLLYPALIFYLGDNTDILIKIGFWIVCALIVTVLGIMFIKSENKILPLVILTVCFIFILSIMLINRIYGSEFDLDPLDIASRDYTFYSGARGGTYFEIGNILANHNEKSHLKIVNDTLSGGSVSNAMHVNADQRAFALVQEDFSSGTDMLSDNLKFVAPLYMERLHILCRKELFNGAPLVQTRLDSQAVEITDENILRILSTHLKKSRKININIGPAGSGNRLLAGYILNEIDKKIEENKLGRPDYQTSPYNPYVIQRLLKKPYTGNAADTIIDIAFYLGASPREWINDLLIKKQYYLLSLGSSFIAGLNKEYNLHLRITDFNGAYGCSGNIKYDPKYAAVSSVATLAFLVTHKYTPKKDIMKVLCTIHDYKDSINKKLFPQYYSMIKAHSTIPDHRHNCPFPLDEYDFYDYYKTKYNDTFNTTIGAIIGLLVPIVSVILIILKQLPYLFSLRKKWEFNKLIAEAARTSTEKKMKDIRRQILESYRNGGLVESHYDALKAGVDDLVLEHYPRHETNGSQAAL